jgi:hypothetical protein
MTGYGAGSGVGPEPEGSIPVAEVSSVSSSGFEETPPDLSVKDHIKSFLQDYEGKHGLYVKLATSTEEMCVRILKRATIKGKVSSSAKTP